jgi:choline dehydrogenase-like flavoprotein
LVAIAALLAPVLLSPAAAALFRLGRLHGDDLLVTCAAAAVVLLSLEALSDVCSRGYLVDQLRQAAKLKGFATAAIARQRTLRFGEDPQSSVLDLDCRTHEIANLYVTDASFFPSIGAVNPTLTIIANALRVAETISKRI